MGRKGKYSTYEKLKYVLSCIEGKASINSTVTMIGITRSSLRQWIYNYQALGIDVLSTTSKNSSYSSTLKIMAVEDYFTGVGSLLDICRNMVLDQLANYVIGL